MSRTSVLAKLLATENIDVVYKGTRTAAFDVVNRVLYMPIWKEISKDLEDLLTGHEVGHALFTPSEGWHESDKSFDFPRAYINVIEDIRIERLIQAKYPGLKGSFKRGYMELIERNFFGTADVELETLGFMDRLNIKAKARNLMDVPFNEDEIPYVKLAMGVESFDDVLDACQVIYDWLKEQRDNESAAEQPQEMPQENFDEDEYSEPTPPGPEADSSSEDEKQNEGEPTSANSGEKSKSTSEDKTESPKDDAESDKSEEPAESKPVKSAGSNGNIDDISTDDTFRENENQLLETNKRGDLPKASTGISKETIKQVVVPYKDAINIRNEFIEPLKDAEYYVDYYSDAIKQFNEFMDESKKTVNTMAKEFEMRKAAFQHARATTAKSGALDVTKLHSYKFNDDLFLRTTTLADAKNHGLVALIDFSGSMQDVLRNVVDQAIVLGMFCRSVGIPFEIYSFTTTGYTTFRERVTQKNGEIECDALHIVQQLSSTMSKAEFFAAAESLYIAYTRDRWSMPFLSPIDGLGGTPLNETLIIMNEIIKEFKRKNAIQKVNLVTITDGDGGWVNVVGSNSWGYNDVYVRMNNKNVKIPSASRDAGTTEILKSISDSGVNIVGYFIISNLREVRNKFWHIEKYDNMRKELRENKVAQVSKNGYDSYFILDGRQDAVNDEFEVKDNASKGDIVRAFKKFSKSKKANRALAVGFAKAVA